MKAAFLDSLRELAKPLQGFRVLLWGYSGAGFPGGDSANEAAAVLPTLGVHCVRSHDNDPAAADKLAADYDLAIVCNTRVGAVLAAPGRLWECSKRRAYAFWDLRPGEVARDLRGRFDRVYLSYSGPWQSPDGATYDPRSWAPALGCPVGYSPQAAPLRQPVPEPGGPRVVFVGDLNNRTYHQGRREMCRALGATVVNAARRAQRLEIEVQLSTRYPSARYALSMSPRAPGYTSIRTYSILACGGLLLLHRFPGADDIFCDGEDAVLFDDADDALRRMAELDGDAAERFRIAENGRRLHATRHTVAHRVLGICREMAS